MTRKAPDVKAWLADKRNLRMLVAGIVVAVVALLALPIVGSSSPAFFSRYHSLTLSYENLETSAHQGIACVSCHDDSRGPVAYSLAVAVDFYANIIRSDKDPIFVAFDTPSRDACLSCHGDAWSMDLDRTSTIPHPAHLRVASETRECVTCHKWTAHEETYMEKHKEMPFSGVCVAYGCHVGTKKADDCFSCHHVLSDRGETWLADHPDAVRQTGANTCFESCHDSAECRTCHTTGERPEFSGPAIRTGLNELEAAHIQPDWMERHGAQAIENQAVCMECHVTDGECRACHTRRPESHGARNTWIGTHSKQTDSEDDPRCLTCHEKPWCVECHDQFKEMR